MWAALSWDLVASQKAGVGHENNFLHESFHIVQMRLGRPSSFARPENSARSSGKYGSPSDGAASLTARCC
jgi:hypothetical protein